MPISYQILTKFRIRPVYFGPFISALAARETIRVIRKIWPYCTERKRKSQPCFYYQIGRCLGICAGKINKQEYMRRVIKPLIMFLEGKKKKIITNYELRITNLEKTNINGGNNEILDKFI